jgi:hypothetical protein
MISLSKQNRASSFPINSQLFVIEDTMSTPFRGLVLDNPRGVTAVVFVTLRIILTVRSAFLMPSCISKCYRPLVILYNIIRIM